MHVFTVIVTLLHKHPPSGFHLFVFKFSLPFVTRPPQGYTASPSSHYSPQTRESTRRAECRMFRPKDFKFAGEEGGKKIFIWAIPIHLEITEHTKRYWFRGHGLKSNNTFLFIMFAVPCVSHHMADAAWVYSFVKLKPLMVRPPL